MGERGELILKVEEEFKSIFETPVLLNCLEKEKDWIITQKRLIQKSIDTKEIDILLHWKEVGTNKHGFFTSLRQQLYPKSGVRVSRHMQIAFNYDKNI
jgi:predicted transposase YbfD/YdcC